MSLANTSGVNDRWPSPATGSTYVDGYAVFHRSLPADVRLLASARADLRIWLAACGATPDDCDAIVLACSEAIANSIEHAYRGDGRGIVAIAGRVDGKDIELSVHDAGIWIPVSPSGSEIRGRGLALIAHLMDTAAIDTRDGTTILMRRTFGYHS